MSYSTRVMQGNLEETTSYLRHTYSPLGAVNDLKSRIDYHTVLWSLAWMSIQRVTYLLSCCLAICTRYATSQYNCEGGSWKSHMADSISIGAEQSVLDLRRNFIECQKHLLYASFRRLTSRRHACCRRNSMALRVRAWHEMTLCNQFSKSYAWTLLRWQSRSLCSLLP